MEVLMPKSLLSVNVSGNIPMPGSLRRTPREHSPSRAHFSGHPPIDAPKVTHPKQLVCTQLSAMRSPLELIQPTIRRLTRFQLQTQATSKTRSFKHQA